MAAKRKREATDRAAHRDARVVEGDFILFAVYNYIISHTYPRPLTVPLMAVSIGRGQLCQS